MPTATLQKVNYPRSMQMDALSVLGFNGLATGTITNPANSSIQGRLVLPTSCKVYRVTLYVSAATTGAPVFNVVVGEGADGSPSATLAPTDGYFISGASPPTAGAYVFATAGNAFFAADQAFTTTAAGFVSFTPTNWDAIYAAGQCLTLRLGGTSTVQNIQAVCLIKPYDTVQWRPLGTVNVPNAGGLVAGTSITPDPVFNPAIDIA
jgi:hypothetical protein